MGQQTLRPTHGFGGFGAPVGSHSALAARITVLIVRIAAGQRLSGRNANIQQVYQLVGVSDFMWVPAGRYVLTQGYVLWRKPFRPPPNTPKNQKAHTLRRIRAYNIIYSFFYRCGVHYYNEPLKRPRRTKNRCHARAPLACEPKGCRPRSTDKKRDTLRG